MIASTFFASASLLLLLSATAVRASNGLSLFFGKPDDPQSPFPGTQITSAACHTAFGQMLLVTQLENGARDRAHVLFFEPGLVQSAWMALGFLPNAVPGQLSAIKYHRNEKMPRFTALGEGARLGAVLVDRSSVYS